MRPGIAAVASRAPRARCVSASSMRLHSSRPKAYMRVDVAVVPVGGEQALADAQQRLGVAAVEGMELAELAGQKIARPFGGHVLVDLQAAVGVAVDPGRGRGEPGLLAGVGVPGKRLGAGEILARSLAAFVGVHRQHEVGRHHRQQRAACFLVGGGDELGEPVAEGQPFVAQEVERGDRLRTGVARPPALDRPAPRFVPVCRCPTFACRGRLGKTGGNMKRRHLLAARGARRHSAIRLARRRFPSGRSVSSCPMRRAARPTPPRASSPRSSRPCSASR